MRAANTVLRATTEQLVRTSFPPGEDRLPRANGRLFDSSPKCMQACDYLKVPQRFPSQQHIHSACQSRGYWDVHNVHGAV
jgi:hypothetical protein